MDRWIKNLWQVPIRHHFWGSLAVVLGVAAVISAQITDRTSFADSELKQDVMERWGAPITQPAPSVRFVPSGAVFNTLTPMALAKQHVEVEAAMNYRKRGLIYFSGFDFGFAGRYEVQNDQDRDIDLVFVFPVQADRNQILLSDLTFLVNGEPAPVDLTEGDALVWTGRAKKQERLSFDIRFRGRGLDAFTYLPDPALRVNDFRLTFRVSGGANYDYQPGVVPATEVSPEGDAVGLTWRYGSLESGVPVGLILPSEQAFDQLIATMVIRAPAPFVLFFLGLVALGLWRRRSFKIWEAYLLAAGYALFYVVLAYFAAFVDFYSAYGLALLLVASLLTAYLAALHGRHGALAGLGLTVSFLVVPSLAVVLQGYTGLIYTLEIASLLAGLMFFTTRPAFTQIIARLELGPNPEEAGHAA